jgi:putative exporter of polyketide antibiotics
MSYLYWSRLAFWTFVVVAFIGAIIAAFYIERMERLDQQQRQLAEDHLRKRRIERFKNLNN